MAKVGRPTKFDKSMCGDIIGIMEQGLSKEAAAAKLGISERSFYYWQEENEEFLQAVKEGERRSLLWWEEKGIEGMTGKIQGFNATTWIFNMKNRHKWKDATQLSNDPDNPLPTPVINLNTNGSSD